MAKKYVCKNPACSLGNAGQFGRFTGGITKEQATLLTGNPDPEYGAGVCTNCGQKGEPWDSTKAQKGALADAKAQYEAQVAAIKGGVA